MNENGNGRVKVDWNDPRHVAALMEQTGSELNAAGADPEKMPDPRVLARGLSVLLLAQAFGIRSQIEAMDRARARQGLIVKPGMKVQNLKM